MSLLMVLWSPLWCCCWLSGGFDRVAGASTTAAHSTVIGEAAGATSESRVCESFAPSAQGCPMCAASAERERTPESPSRPGCHCHDQARDTAVLKADVDLVLVGWIALPPLAAVSEPIRAVAALPLLRAVVATAPSPPPTLVRLHTLLLT